MSDLFDDLQDSNGQDYFYALDSAPGGVTPTTAVLTLFGRAASVQELTQVTRSPATAVLTLNGLSLTPDFVVTPATAALSMTGQVPGELRSLIVTPAIPAPDYGELQSTAPTILFINTVTPTTGLLQLSSLGLNVTQGGNIGFITPQVGTLTLNGLPAALPRTVGVAELSIAGLQPTLYLTGTVTPDPGALTLEGLVSELDTPFTWIDVDAPPATSWTTTTAAA